MTEMDIVGPAIGAGVFVLIMSLVREPTRRTLNAVIVAGASGVYLSGGFGVWELVYPVVVMPVVYRALRSYRYIGLAWLMHAAWDLPHHLWGNPIWPFMWSSSFGCFVFDSLIAVWFLAGAPAVARRQPNASRKLCLDNPSSVRRLQRSRAFARARPCTNCVSRAPAVLDLEELMLTDVEAVRFLLAVERAGIVLRHCAPFIREWMARELNRD
jgi:hypothetical protein